MPPSADGEEAHLLPAQDASHDLPSVPLASASSSADRSDGVEAGSDSDSATLGRPSDERHRRKSIEDVFDEDYSTGTARPHGRPPGFLSRFRSWRRGVPAAPPAPAAADD